MKNTCIYIHNRACELSEAKRHYNNQLHVGSIIPLKLNYYMMKYKCSNI